MKSLFIASAALSILIFSTKTAMAYVIERDNVRLFQVIESSEGKMKTLRIRGMQTGSLGVCAKPKLKTKGKILCVVIKKKVVGKGLGTGPFFDVTLKLPEQVDKVVFGKAKTEIWPKDTAAKEQSANELKIQDLVKAKLLEAKPQVDPSDISIEVKSQKDNCYYVMADVWNNGKPSNSYFYNVTPEKNQVKQVFSPSVPEEVP